MKSIVPSHIGDFSNGPTARPVLGYCRSMNDPISLEEQKRLIAEACERHFGALPVRVAEERESGYSTLHDLIREHPGGIVVSEKPSRFGRSLLDMIEVGNMAALNAVDLLSVNYPETDDDVQEAKPPR